MYPNDPNLPNSALPIFTTESKVSTYRVQVADVTVAALATDVLVLTGSATKKVKVKLVQLTADATAPSVIDFYVKRRATPNTGGASTAPAILKCDSANAAPTATVTLYSANPVINDAGILATADHYALPAAAATGYPGMPWTEEFGTRSGQSVVLNGVNEQLCVGLNGQTIPAGFSLYAAIEWSEE